MRKLRIGDLEQVGTCTITLRNKKIMKRWPVFLIDGVWGLTAFPHWTEERPDLESEWLSITHLPTGNRAGDMRVDDPRKKQILAKYAQMFGGARTFDGVMRKYRKLSKSRQLWIKQQISWLLPSKVVKP